MMSVSAVVATACGLALYFVIGGGGGALTYRVGDSSASASGGVIRSDGAAELPVVFSEGTTLVLDGHSRGRVRDLSRNGARFALEKGRVTAAVVPRPGAKWYVNAGPFEVVVTGTRFDVAWQGEPERLVVNLHSGGVMVRGPLAGDGIALTAGQRLVIRLDHNEVELSRLPAPVTSTPPAPSPPPPAPTASEPEAPAPTPTDMPRAAGAAPHATTKAALSLSSRAWRQALKQGHFEQIVSAAEEQGIARVLKEAPASALSALADAARYGRKPELAQDTLLAIRRRFVRSPAAADAAFFLGWLADESGDAKRAQDWYKRHMLESPRGTYADQSLGRHMLLLQRIGDTAEARRLAEEYLERHPRGTYAEAARKLAGGG